MSNSTLAGARAAALIVNAARKTITTARSDFSNVGTLPRLCSQSEATENSCRYSAASGRPTWLPPQVEQLDRWAFEPSKVHRVTPANTGGSTTRRQFGRVTVIPKTSRLGWRSAVAPTRRRTMHGSARSLLEISKYRTLRLD